MYGIEENGDDEDSVKLDEINMTNQLIGEVQGFIFVMRWLLFEFYGFKKLKNEGFLEQ